jgi:molybdopterin converting factor small subunit
MNSHCSPQGCWLVASKRRCQPRSLFYPKRWRCASARVRPNGGASCLTRGIGCYMISKRKGLLRSLPARPPAPAGANRGSCLSLWNDPNTAPWGVVRRVVHPAEACPVAQRGDARHSRMIVSIQGTGSLRARIPSGTTLEDVHTVGEAILRVGLPQTDGLAILVNGRLADWNTALADNDSIQLIPALAGG